MGLWGPSSREMSQAVEIEQLKRKVAHERQRYIQERLLFGRAVVGCSEEEIVEAMKAIGLRRLKLGRSVFDMTYPDALYISPA